MDVGLHDDGACHRVCFVRNHMHALVAVAMTGAKIRSRPASWPTLRGTWRRCGGSDEVVDSQRAIDDGTGSYVAPVGDVTPRPEHRASFAEFYRTEWPAAVRLAGLLTQRASLAEDLAQDAFTRMYPKWAQATNPPGYLRVTVVNACRQWERHNGVQRAKLPLLATIDSVELASSDLADAVASLPYRQRAVLVLRYYADLTESEIAEALGCRAGTVKSLASRALARLQKEIQR